MQENQNKNTYVTLPNRGDYEVQTLLEIIKYLRQLAWTYKLWAQTPALIDKSGNSSRPYVGQNFDPKYFDLVEDGWTHDHCEICSQPISNIDGYGDRDGYKADNGEWICKNCYDLFIKPADIEATIQSLKTTYK